MSSLKVLFNASTTNAGFGNERYSSSHSKKVRPAVGRQICLRLRFGRPQRHRLESDGQRLTRRAKATEKPAEPSKRA
jgi:hypothetical protein